MRQRVVCCAVPPLPERPLAGDWRLVAGARPAPPATWIDALWQCPSIGRAGRRDRIVTWISSFV